MIGQYTPNAETWALLDAACCDSLDADQAERLEIALRADERLRDFYLDYFQLHAELTRSIRLEHVRENIIESIHHSSPSLTEPSILTNETSSFPSLSPLPSLSTTHYPLSTNFVGGPVFSYMVATVVLCAMLLSAWAYKITHSDGGFVDNSKPYATPMDQVEFVGRIIGMVDCKWSDPDTQPYAGSYVPLGRKYELTSGLLEITYTSGARIILEGPCTYKVDSRAGGFMTRGKLTARVEKRGAAGAKPRAAISQSLTPLFSVTTPTVVVTDLGTEFGVEVDASGDCWTHVYQGKVELKLTNVGGSQGPVHLEKNDSARVIRRTLKVEVTHGQSPTRKFARSIPKRVRLELHSTGVGLQEGDADTHWRIIAISGDPDLKPRQALVTATPPYGRWLWNQPRRGQWISLTNGPDDVPRGTYTFRTTFQLSKDGLNAAAINGSFWADNHVEAIRINGRKIKVKEHGYNIPFNESTPFVIEEGFVEGENVLEFDVLNGGGDNAFPDMPNPMGLRVEMKSVVRNSVKTGDIEPPSQAPANIQQKGDRK